MTQEPTLRVGLKPTEAARLLGVSPDTIYRAVRRGELPAVRISGRIVIPAAALVEQFGQPIDLDAA